MGLHQLRALLGEDLRGLLVQGLAGWRRLHPHSRLVVSFCGPFVAPPEQTFSALSEMGSSEFPLPFHRALSSRVFWLPLCCLPGSQGVVKLVEHWLAFIQATSERNEAVARPPCTVTFYSTRCPWVQSHLDQPCLHAEKCENLIK